MHPDLFGSTLTLEETAELLRAEADDRIAVRLEQSAAAGRPSTCKPGCAACCHQLVVVSPLEAHGIAAYLRVHPEVAEAFHGRLAAWRETVAALPDLAQQLTHFQEAAGYIDGDAGGKLEESYWQASLPCPFLDAGRCTIYPVRPFACREHHVVSSPELCSLDLDRPEPAPTRLEHKTVAGWIGSRAFFLPDVLIPLPLAVEYSGANAEEAGREADEGIILEAAEDARMRLSRAFKKLAGGA